MQTDSVWLIYKEFRFEAAHRLPHHQGKCRRLHGHSWLGKIYVKSNHLMTTGPEQGMVLDFGKIKQYLKPLLEDYLDHHYLNETTGLENPTSEAIAQWIFTQLKAKGLPGLHAVEIRETCTSGAYYQPLEENQIKSENVI
ncbi:6-carboxytetrahydropterin synthase QueD [Gloeocapsa sp. PCC 73106]|uniref:6-carboxytetrahydropterin synthase QueD n=1 Tax=Gloeocapsa sp. PCC 73106 TaxID=102232 RepID=UPI0002ACC42D|nr:6-carboxytetrahydropterin synthase QueD [Gloeocapsa sp. PCC 73106]ELR99252.1 queuosine biosynthesis protein QueD [Gloeocapsa sp. PCC 73106]